MVEGDRVGHVGRDQLEDRPRVRRRTCSPTTRDTRSLASVVRASAHPPSTSPTTQSSGTMHVVEEHLVEQLGAGDLAQGTDVMPGRAHVDEEVGDPSVLPRVGIGAGETDAHVRFRRDRGPDLLSPERPALGHPGRPRAQRGEVGARAGFAEQLAPARVSPWSVGATHRSFCSGVPWAMMVGRAHAATARFGRRNSIPLAARR